MNAYGYVDASGRIRALTMSRADAMLNARLNGAARIAVVKCTDRGTVPAAGAIVVRWEDVR